MLLRAVTLFLLLGSASLFAEEPQWHTTLDAAIAEAEASGKPILMEVNGRPWCPPCVDQHTNILSKPAFAAWAREHVVLLDIKVGDGYDRESGHPDWKAMMQRYGLQGIPSIVFIDTEEQPLGAMTPIKEIEAWIAKADQILGDSIKPE